MRYIFLLLSIIIVSCSADQSSSEQTQAKAEKATTEYDSVKVDTSVEFVTGQFNYRSHEDFIKLDPTHVDNETYLHDKTYEAFKAMADSAKKDGITLTIISGTRSFAEQKFIWERKWANSDASSDLEKANQILEYSSMPMTSRHHWGTDIDINDLNNSYFESGQGQKEYRWLQENANAFGFYQPYTNKSVNNRTGYNEEKWHWSYMPLANQFLAYYNQNITNADITGFKGSELASEIDMVENYVNGLSVKIKNYQR